MKKNPLKNNSSKIKKRNLKELIYHEIFIIILAVLVISIIVGIISYYQMYSKRVYIEKAEIKAPIISLKPSSPGILNQVFVKVGDSVLINTVVADVGGRSIRTKTNGIITYVNNVPGQYVTPQDTIVKMFDPQELRVVGHLREDKGLSKIRPGQRVIFKVDAFGSKEYSGIVESVSPSARQSDVVFSISNKREEKEFDVIVKFGSEKYPELKNRMSAKMWVYIKD